MVGYSRSDADRSYVKECHFLVIHLSYIEAIVKEDKNTTNGNEENGHDTTVVRFIKKHIAPWLADRENFFLVIATGRGRNEWWSGLDRMKEENMQQYTRFTLFRPVEAILEAVENSIGMQDDVELKYRITKILYGS